MQKGNVAYRRGDKEAAAEYYRRALAHDRTREAASFNLGRVLLEQGRYQDAKELFDQALPLELIYPLVRVYRARALLGLGEAAEAESDLVRVVRVHRDVPEARLQLAELRRSQSRWREVIELVEPLRHDPVMLEEATLLSAEALYESGQRQEAIARLESLLTTHALRAETYFTLGRYLAEEGRSARAQDLFERGLEIAPGHPEGVAALARLQGENPE